MPCKASYAGLSDMPLMEHGVTGNWSVRDIIAHLTSWEEALKHLPLILNGGKPPRYSVTYGGIDAFNALITERKKDVSLTEVLMELDQTDSRLDRLDSEYTGRSIYPRNALRSSPAARYLQPLPEACPGDTHMAKEAVSWMRVLLPCPR